MITASIVIYKTEISQIDKVINSIINSRKIDLVYIIDNSPTSENELLFKQYASKTIIEYIPHNNTGYGSSHNIAINKAIEIGADYHIILNPDIYFDEYVISELYEYMNRNMDVGYILPNVIYPDGQQQYLCKLLPNPFDLILRRFSPKTRSAIKHNERYELRKFGYNKIINPPCLSGCFMFLRVSTLKENNLLFDERFFMYCEDFDLIRRIHRVSKTIFYPNKSIVHNHMRDSYKNRRMMFLHIKSAIKYFNKWGWFFDKERKEFNDKILDEIQYYNQ